MFTMVLPDTATEEEPEKQRKQTTLNFLFLLFIFLKVIFSFVQLTVVVHPKLNLLNSKDHDIDYYYASQLKGEATPVNDVQFHPVEPLGVRGGVAYTF